MLDLALKYAAIIASTATFLGIPLAIFVLIRDRREAQRAREDSTYQTLEREYRDHLQMCMDNIDLRLYDYDVALNRVLTPEQETRRLVGFYILVVMLEAAFFFYRRGTSSRFRQQQWTGWEAYIRGWAGREDFRLAWKRHLNRELDAGFIDFMNRLVAEVEKGQGQQHQQSLQPA